MSNFENIPKPSSSKEHLPHEDAFSAAKVTYRDKKFEKTALGWVDMNNPAGYVIPLDMPFAQDLERLLQAQQEEKMGEVSRGETVFERYTSGWVNKERPDYVIPLSTPAGQDLERLLKSQQE